MLKIDYKAVEFGFCFVVFYAHSYFPTIKTGHAILNDTRKHFFFKKMDCKAVQFRIHVVFYDLC